MKLIAVVFILIVGFLAYRFFQSRPRLIAVASLEGKIVLWGDADPKKATQIEEAFQLAKDSIPKTLELRIKTRAGNFVEALPTTVYFIEENDWFYIFADNYPYKAPGIELVGDRRFKNSIHFHKQTKKFELKEEIGD